MPLQPLYNRIGAGYNITRRADPYLLDRIVALLQPQRDKNYLDIGCGTGNYTIALAGKGFHFTGIDPSEKMLAEARAKSPDVNWMNGSVEKIPAADNSFDGVLATLTVHHWQNPEAGFRELARVCRDQSRLVIFTSTPEQMRGYWLFHYFPAMMETSTAKMPAAESVKEWFSKAGFEFEQAEKYFVRDDLSDLFLQSGKNKPEIYFDADIRRGISSFASLSTEKEVEAGLARLKRDLDSGEFEAVKKRYENTHGDYLFLSAILERS